MAVTYVKKIGTVSDDELTQRAREHDYLQYLQMKNSANKVDLDSVNKSSPDSAKYHAAKRKFEKADAADTVTYNKYYEEYKNATKNYKKDLKYSGFKDRAKAAKEWAIVGDGISKDEAKEHYKQAKINNKSNKTARDNIKVEEYKKKQNYNTQLLNNKMISDYAKTIVDNEELSDESREWQEQQNATYPNANPMDAYITDDYVQRLKTSGAEAEKARKSLEDLNIDVDDLLDVYRRKRGNENIQQMQSDVKKLADESPALASTASVIMNTDIKSNAGTLVDSAYQGISAMVHDEYKGSTDNTSMTYMPSLVSSAIRGTVSENIENGTDNEAMKTALPMLYQTGMSIMDSAVAAAFPGKSGLATLGLVAGAAGVNDAAHRGLSADKAFLTGFSQALNEMFFEKFSIGSFKGMAGNVMGSFFVNVLKQMGVEATEEVFTEIANMASDYVINKDDSNISYMYDKALYDATQNGSQNPDADAKIDVFKQLFGQVLEAAAGGAISGGVFGAAGTAISKGTRYSVLSDIGSTMKAGDTTAIQNEINTALLDDTNSDTYKIAAKLQSQLEQNAYENNSESFDYSILDNKTLGELRQRNTQQQFKEGVSEAISGDENFKKIEKVIDDISSGKTVSKSQAKIIRNSKVAVGAINNELGTNYSASDINAKLLTEISSTLAFGTIERDLLEYEQDSPTTVFNKNGTKSIENNNPSYSIPASLTDNTQIKVNQDRPFEKANDVLKIRTTAGAIDIDSVTVNNSDVQAIINAVSESDVVDISGANAITANYSSGIADRVANHGGVDFYIGAAKMLYNDGLASNGESFESYMRKNKNADTLRMAMTTDIARNIYRSGQTDKEAYNKAQSKMKANKNVVSAIGIGDKRPAKEGTGKYRNETGKPSELDGLYSLIANELGYDIVLVNNEKANGFILPSEKAIYINQNETTEFKTLIHETTHYIKLNNSDEYSTIEKSVLGWYKAHLGSEQYNKRQKEYQNRYKKYQTGNTTEDIDEEMTADAMAAIFSNKKNKDSVQDFADWTAKKSNAEQNKIKQAFKAFFDKLISTIQKLLDNVHLSDYQMEYLEMSEYQAQSFRRMWLNALDKATNAQKNNTTIKNSEIKYSFKNIVDIGKVDKENIRYKGGFIIESESNLKSVIEESLHNNQIKKNFYLGNIKPGVKERITKDLGIDIFKDGDYSFLISSDDIRHINKHFKNVGDITGAIYRLYDVINNYDTVFIDETEKQKYNKNKLIFNKHYSDFDYRSVEIISKKNRTFDLVSFFITKNNKKRNKGNGLANTSKLGVLASQTVFVSNNNISQKDTTVNNHSMQNDVKYSLNTGGFQNEFEETQKQIMSLRNKISYLKNSDDYIRMVNNISSSYGTALDTALTEYGKWLNDSGLNDAIRNLDKLQKKDKKLRKKIADNDSSDIVLKDITDFSTKEIEKYITKAEKYFGTTDNYKLAGYLTLNGKMLDFSDGQRTRVQDHREINDVLDFLNDNSNFSDGLIAFMNMGNVRLNNYGIDISKVPNEKQIVVLRKIFDKLNGEVTVDFSNKNGDTIANLDYISGTSANKIINDINYFYKNGKLPEQSVVSQFHTKYSLDMDYSYETLVSKPDMPITIIDDSQAYAANRQTRKDIINKSIQNAKEVGSVNSNGNAVIYVNDIDTNIIVPKTAMQHSLDRRLNVNAQIVLNVGNILKNSIRINELNPRSENIKNSYALIGMAKNVKNEPYVVMFVVNKFSNEVETIDVLYSANAKTEPAGSLSPQVSTPATDSKISISNLLDYVNRYYPDILPEDVLRHYGYNHRPDGTLGESALYSLEIEHEAEQLKMQNEKLQKANEYLKQEFQLTHGRVTNASAALAIAKRIKCNWNTQMTSAEIANKLVVLSDDGANGGYGTYEDLYHKAHKIAESVIENQQIHIDDYSREILDTIRSYNFYLTESQKGTAAEVFGSYGEFYRSNFGRMKIQSNADISLVDVWNELCESYPEYFSKDIHDNDMAVELADIISALKDNTVSEYGFDREGAETALTTEIIEAYFDLPMKQTYADKVQKEINRLKYEYKTALQENKIDSKARYEAELKNVKEHYKNRIKQEKDAKWDRVRQEKEIRKRMLKDQRIRKNESAEKTKLKASIRKSLNKIARLGANPTKDKHLPNSIIDSVKALASAITLGESQYDTKLTARLNDIRNGFEYVSNNNQYNEQSELYKNDINQKITELQKKSGDKNINELSVSDLKEINDLIKMTVHSINNINRLFAQDRNATLSEYVENINAELSPMAKKEKFKLPYNLIYGSMKPEYFFEYLGSDTLTQLYKSLQKGEDVYAADVYSDKQFLDGKRKKCKADKWDWKKVYTIETSAGETLDFSLGQVLAIYANTKRKQCRNHLLGGGIKYEPVKNKIKEHFVTGNDQSVHRMNEKDVFDIISNLSEEQKAYVDDVIKYMSTVVSEKGNSVSRQLYDIEMFNEKSYYPIMTESNYIHSTSTETKGAKKIINSGFTKATIEGAENPIFLMEFDEVVARHLDDMAKYHAFALPLEDFDRVYHAFGKNDNGDYGAIKTVIENAYTKSATSYIDKLLEDINGNVIRSAETGTEKFISLWKKNAVMASASVVIQQPSAVARALSEIDAKYFTKFTFGIKKNNEVYEQIKKYAPVAILKEMGAFDTGTARSTVDYLVNKKSIKNRIDDIMSVGAEKADQLTWVHIWNACVNESKSKNKGTSEEEILEIAGERFTDVIKKTQVYDSVFSRSGLMRSKDNFSKITTAFMAEPTTSLNMAVNAFIQAKRGKISKNKAAMTLTSLMLASVLNTMLKRLVKAARDDDEDKTFWEKYISGIPSDFIDEINPLNNIAVVKDIYSIFKGYDIDRADMTLISEFYDAFNKLSSDSIETSEKIERIASATAGLFGLPVKNVLRDIHAVFNIIKGSKSDLEYSKTVTIQSVNENLADTFVFDNILETLFGVSIFDVKDKNNQLYYAVIDDDTEVYNRLTSGKDEEQIASKLKSSLVENDMRIAESAIAYAGGKMSLFDRLVAELVSDGFDEEIAVDAVKIYYNTMKQAKVALDEKDMETYDVKLQRLLESGYNEDKIRNAISSIEIEEESTNDLSQIYNAEMVAKALDENNYASAKKYIDSIVDIKVANGKTKDEARKSIKTSITGIYKPVYLANSNERISIESKLMKTGLYDKEDFPKWIARSYDTDSMLTAFDNGHENTKKYIQERINAKIAAGQTEKQAVSGIKSVIANEYKEKFLNGNVDERAQIITYMQWTGLYGDRPEIISYINRYWLE